MVLVFVEVFINVFDGVVSQFLQLLKFFNIVVNIFEDGFLQCMELFIVAGENMLVGKQVIELVIEGGQLFLVN